MAISYLVSSVPEISISLAPYEEPMEEPPSPFACLSPVQADEGDGYRSALLTPPPASSPRASPLSPLRPVDIPVKGKGLERERFEALLKASRERNASIGGARRPQDLRKEVALKAHQHKQHERRALFLSKLQAPPSPSAAEQPKTPPESPAVLHYSLPSPGLNSPLAHFDMLAHQQGDACKPWVEQVDFRLPEGERTKRVHNTSRKSMALPSLAEISARLSSQGQLPTLTSTPAKSSDAPPRRLPAFLREAPASARVAPRNQSPPALSLVNAAPVQEAKPKRQLLPIGRLQMPTRPHVVGVEAVQGSPVQEVEKESREHLKPYAMPKSPSSPRSPTIKVTTTVVPRTSHKSLAIGQSGSQAFNARASKAKDMLSTLRRRSAAPSGPSLANGTLGNGNAVHGEDIEKHVRRRSAPAELQRRERREFAHPVLALPGGF